MKKILSLIMAALVGTTVAGCLAGCSSAGLGSDEIAALRVSQTPANIQYEVNGSFSAEGGKLKVVYGDGRISELDMNAEGVSLSDVDMNKAGKQTVVVRYGDKTTSFVVYVGAPSLPKDEDDKPDDKPDDNPAEEKAVVRIVVSSTPEKSEYFVGDEVDFKGGALTVTYADRSTATIPFTNKGVTFGKIDNTTKGNKTVTVNYGGKKATFSVRFLGVAGSVTFRDYGTEDLQVKVAENSGVVCPETPQREGYTFAGWYSDENCIYPYDFSAKNIITKDTTIYSYWKNNSLNYYEVEIDLNYYGIKTVKYKQTVKSGEPARLIADPARSEYEFEGWYTDEALTVKYVPGAAVQNDIVLHAKWRKMKTAPSTYTFEAEDTDLSGKTGMSNSGSPIGPDMISSSGILGASGTRFVTYLYKKGLSLEFHIASGEAADATIVFYIAAELPNITINQNNYKISVNGETPDYGTLDLPNGDVFKGWITMHVRLQQGYNLIQMTTDNDVNPVGNGTYAGTAPMVDCITITTEAVLAWDENYNLPIKDNY